MDSTELQKLLTSQDVEVDHKVQEVFNFFSLTEGMALISFPNQQELGKL